MIKSIIYFEEFEKAVMQKIMEKDTTVNIVLREQYKQAEIIDRDFTGAGFFTSFKIPDDAPRITEVVQYDYGDVYATINGIYGYGFILFIKNGIIFFLEGYTWQDEWPDIIQSYELIHETCNYQG